MGVEGTAFYSFNTPSPQEGVRIEFRKGDACHNGDARTFAVNLIPGAPNSGDVLEFLGETSHCHYEFTLTSPKVIKSETNPPVIDKPECRVWSPPGTDYVYHPEDLMLPGGEFYTAQTDVTGSEIYEFVLNICGPVPCVGTDQTNPASACQTTGSDSFSLGSQASATFETLPYPYPPSAGFVMALSGGDTCHNNDAREAIVTVLCSDEDIEPRLVFEEEFSHCKYALTLYAADACPEGGSTPPPAPGPACPARVDSATGEFYYTPGLLTLPPSSPYTVTGYGDEGTEYQYSLNVCGTVAGCHPGPGSGSSSTDIAACQTVVDPHAQHSLGEATQVSVVEASPPGEGVTITYQGGDPCSSNDVRTTVIHTHCVRPDGDALPAPELVFIGETSHCLYEFDLFSTAACPIPNDAPTTISCADTYLPSAKHPGQVYDFHKLQFGGDSVFTMPDVEIGEDLYDFTANICGPVDCTRRKDSDIVPAGCQIKKASSSSSKATMFALGDVSSAVIEEDESGESYTVTYTGGDMCHSGDARSLKVHVFCSEGEDTPSVSFADETSHCLYEVNVYASAAAGGCPIVPPQPAPAPESSGMSGVAVAFIVIIILVIAVVGGALAYQTYIGEPPSALLEKLPCSRKPGFAFERLATEEPDDDFSINV